MIQIRVANAILRALRAGRNAPALARRRLRVRPDVSFATKPPPHAARAVSPARVASGELL